MTIKMSSNSISSIACGETKICLPRFIATILTPYFALISKINQCKAGQLFIRTLFPQSNTHRITQDNPEYYSIPNYLRFFSPYPVPGAQLGPLQFSVSTFS